jgi:crossover junction endodeoxyribonuclease RuvC
LGGKISNLKKPHQSIRVLGIDPGSRVTGFGVVEVTQEGPRHITHGVIKTNGISDFSRRLNIIFEGVRDVCEKTNPQYAGVEKTFFAKNAQSALKLGQARGAAITALAQSSVVVQEISPNEVKQALVGHGLADKVQVKFMVQKILGIDELKALDASDALAIAISVSRIDPELDVVPRRFSKLAPKEGKA